LQKSRRRKVPESFRFGRPDSAEPNPVKLYGHAGKSVTLSEGDALEAGLYVALHANVLVAAWDGKRAAQPRLDGSEDDVEQVVAFRATARLAEGRELPTFCRRDALTLDALSHGPRCTFSQATPSGPPCGASVR
jgi:hypothetical protein